MKQCAFFQPMVLLLTSLFLFSGGCTRKQAQAPAEGEDTNTVALTCVGVMPVDIAAKTEAKPRFEHAERLTQGRQMLEQLLRERYSGREKYRFVSSGQMGGMTIEGGENLLARARQVGAFTSCNGVLHLSISRYQDRIGGPYSAETPASAAFSYLLLDVNSGTVLCRGDFDETQQSVLENLFTLDSARQRGFTWITGEELLREGLDQKLGDCPYLDIEP